MIKVYKHPIYSSIQIFLHNQGIPVTLKTGETRIIKGIREYYIWASEEIAKGLVTNFQTFRYGNKVVKLKVVDPSGPQIETFRKNEYNWLKINEKVVIDVGANIGDTSIFFTLNGAARVIAIEPYPANCKLITENFSLNEIEPSKFEVLNIGIGQRDEIFLPEEIINGGAREIEKGKGGVKVEILPLENLVNNIDTTLDLVLKIDCEGCEYEIISQESCDVLRSFSQMQIEYHHDWRPLQFKLNMCGFEVSHTFPRFVPNINSNSPLTLRGYIYATRR